MDTEQGQDEKFMRAATEPAAVAAGELFERNPVVATKWREGYNEAR